MKAPFPWFGGKSRAAPLIWSRLGEVVNYVEPFAGSLAVLLGRPHEPRVETVNDVDGHLCVAPDTRVLMEDMTWKAAGTLCAGERLLAFDEENSGTARAGFRSPARYRHWQRSTVIDAPRVVLPSYRLTFDDGTVVIASEDHCWLTGSHCTGKTGRGWRWVKTKNLAANRSTQRSWVLKAAPVVTREESWEAGWLAGLFDGEGCLNAGPGLRVGMSQNQGIVLSEVVEALARRGFSFRTDRQRKCKHITITGGMREQFRFLMLIRPHRLLAKFAEAVESVSLYGREHNAVGLVSKEYLGPQEVVALSTTSRTFIAEGLASHNCNFWRATAANPEAVATAADWPVNETDLHARHRYLAGIKKKLAARLEADPRHYNAMIAGWWVWGLSAWIGSGWCERMESKQAPLLNSNSGNHGSGRADGRGVHSKAMRRQMPDLGGVYHNEREAAYVNVGKGVHRGGMRRQLPHLGGGDGSGSPRSGAGVNSSAHRSALYEVFAALSARLRYTRVTCGDFARILTPAVTWKHGVTGVVLDPPYEGFDDLYGTEPVSARVRAWCIENGARPDLRIALCGYDVEHVALEGQGWTVEAWKAAGGYSNQAAGENENAKRERVWFSPACLRAPAKAQRSLFLEAI